MTIDDLFLNYLTPETDPTEAINDLATTIDAELAADGSDIYYNIDDNEIRGFFDNDNFYITGINDYELNEPMQFDY